MYDFGTDIEFIMDFHGVSNVSFVTHIVPDTNLSKYEVDYGSFEVEAILSVFILISTVATLLSLSFMSIINEIKISLLVGHDEINCSGNMRLYWNSCISKAQKQAK